MYIFAIYIYIFACLSVSLSFPHLLTLHKGQVRRCLCGRSLSCTVAVQYRRQDCKFTVKYSTRKECTVQYSNCIVQDSSVTLLYSTTTTVQYRTNL